MINYFTFSNGHIRQYSELNFGNEKVIWIDLLTPSQSEINFIEKTFNIELFTKQESEEIESSSKYIETNDEIGINLNFIRIDNQQYIVEPVSFILKDKILITQREFDFRTFNEVHKKIKINNVKEGDDIFLLLLDARIDYDADLIELMTIKVTAISKNMVKNKILDRDLLLDIAALQDSTIVLRENIVEKQRILSSMLKSKKFPKEDIENMRIMIKDVSSLLDHTNFNFERLEFMQNTFLGLVDMEQNRIIKLFTVVTVIFMPPTLIASMYGMNFQYMPELSKTWGYPFAICLMVMSSIITLLFFKHKKWL